MDDTPKSKADHIANLHTALTMHIERLASSLISSSDFTIQDQETLYKLFVTVLAQTLGRHIAGFKPHDQDVIKTECLKQVDRMIDLVEVYKETGIIPFSEVDTVIQVSSTTHNITIDDPYGLADMEVLGNA